MMMGTHGDAPASVQALALLAEIVELVRAGAGHSDMPRPLSIVSELLALVKDAPAGVTEGLAALDRRETALAAREKAITAREKVVAGREQRVLAVLDAAS